MDPSPDDGSLEALLEKLHQGDLGAAEQVFRTYEPYLRLVVRRQLTTALRSKFDSIDIVQSVWVDLLKGFREAGWRFADASQLRGFLVKATRNRFIDRLRQHRRALEHERPLSATPGLEPGPADQEGPTSLARAKELWDRLVQQCPPEHREILNLKREGFTPTEIAQRTGLHPGSVRRILYDLARRMGPE